MHSHTALLHTACTMSILPACSGQAALALENNCIPLAYNLQSRGCALQARTRLGSEPPSASPFDCELHRVHGSQTTACLQRSWSGPAWLQN